MNVSVERTVRELALEYPSATRLFESLGIDYCCGGNRSLEEACAAKNLDSEQVLDSLEQAESLARAGQTKREWQREPLCELIEHIKNTHHKYTREEIARLEPLFKKVCGVHGKNHPELLHIRETFAGLAEELTMHLMKEEMVLFPYVIRMEEARIQREPVVPAPFGTVKHPVAMMMQEHDGAGEALRAMREASSGYVAPEGTCVSYRTLYQALEELEADLHQHIHLENNILFPRAVELEAA